MQGLSNLESNMGFSTTCYSDRFWGGKATSTKWPSFNFQIGRFFLFLSVPLFGMWCTWRKTENRTLSQLILWSLTSLTLDVLLEAMVYQNQSFEVALWIIMSVRGISTLDVLSNETSRTKRVTVQKEAISCFTVRRAQHEEFVQVKKESASGESWLVR